MEAQPSPGEVSELEGLITRQRRMLDELEGRLRESPTVETVNLVRRTLNGRPQRLALARLRRAARAASASPTVHVYVPRNDDPLSQRAREIAEARIYTWERTDEAGEALARGDYITARRMLEDVLASEQAIQILLEDLVVPQPSWQELRDELGRSSDMIINVVEQQLQSIERPGLMAMVRTGQSQWVRAWRPFLMIAGINRAG
jgi:hypothetical protein